MRKNLANNLQLNGWKPPLKFPYIGYEAVEKVL